jgi:hypothetical protein
MTLVPLDIPAGFYRNGTDLEQSGRWRDGSLVRWRDNSLRPIGGWQERKASFCTNPVRGMHAWESNDGSAWLAGGSHSELKAMTGAGVTYDITPSDLAAGREDAEIETGYGYSFYGTGYYGTPRQQLASSVPAEATTWSLDNFGEYLVACHKDDGRLLEWQLGTGSDAAVIANAPTNNMGLLVTEERFIFALGAGGNPRTVSWCDQENNTLWAPASTNQAGSQILQTSGQIMQAIRTKGQTLIITDTDCHAAVYAGPPFIYSFSRVGTSCGAISRKSAVDTDLGVFYMGQRGFFYFDGNSVRELPCDVHDYVFGDFNNAQQSKVWGVANGQFGEIWWFYCSENSTEIDRYVAYDYTERHWLIGNLARTSGTERGVFRYPFMSGEYSQTVNYTVTVVNDGGNKYAIEGISGSAPTLSFARGNTYVFDLSDASNAGHPFAFRTSADASYTTGVTTTGTAGQAGAKVTIVVASDAPDSLKYYCTVHGNSMGNTIAVGGPVSIFEHEVGLNVDSGAVFAESGPVSIGNGDQTAHVTQLVPDENTQGDVNVTFKTRFYPNDTETSHGPFTPTNPTSVRFAGRQLRMRVEGAKLAAWRVGNMRVDVKPAGRR